MSAATATSSFPDTPSAPPPANAATVLPTPFPDDLDLTVTRGPTRLTDAALAVVMASPIPRAAPTKACAAPVQPRASLIVITYNNLPFTRLCLHSLLADSGAPADYELIIVDNASSDGTSDYLRALSDVNPHVRVICNEVNRGFAPANNQALAAARGQFLVLLNNDTIVPAGWLEALTRHLDDPAVGCVCACTNRIGNEAEIECAYRTLGECRRFAARRHVDHAGQRLDIPMAPMFALAMRRSVFEQIGPIDEQYERGMFEDDDYSMRLRAAGLRVCCAEDVFVHHFGGASFGNLLGNGEHGRLFDANRKRFEAKWGVAWRPHRRRRMPDYEQLVEMIRSAVAAVVPRGSTLAVITKGDEELLKLEGQRAWHFPRLEDGQYAGHYPADGPAAAEHLDQLRRAGAQYLLIPRPAMWWLEHYPELSRRLEESARPLAVPDDCCAIYDLRDTRPNPAGDEPEHWQDRHLRELAAAICPPDAVVRIMESPDDLRAPSGADYIAIPDRRRARLEQVPELLRSLESRCRMIARRDNVGRIYAMDAAEPRSQP